MNTFQDLIQTLKNNNTSQEEVAVIVGEVVKAAALKLYSQSMLLLTDEQKQQIEDLEDDSQADQLLQQFYKQQTGLTYDEAIVDFRDQFAKSFLEKYQPAH